MAIRPITECDRFKERQFIVSQAEIIDRLGSLRKMKFTQVKKRTFINPFVAELNELFDSSDL